MKNVGRTVIVTKPPNFTRNSEFDYRAVWSDASPNSFAGFGSSAKEAEMDLLSVVPYNQILETFSQ